MKTTPEPRATRGNKIDYAALANKNLELNSNNL